MEKEIVEVIGKILSKGYEIKISENGISVVEIYKSVSREKYHEIEAFRAFGALKYFEKGTLRITLNKLRDWEKALPPHNH